LCSFLSLSFVPELFPKDAVQRIVRAIMSPTGRPGTDRPAGGVVQPKSGEESKHFYMRDDVADLFRLSGQSHNIM
jgi:hypothetical protein